MRYRMKNFKKIMSACHTQNKTCLHDLYTDRQVYYSSVSSSEQPVEDEKIYDYRSVPFQFTGTGFRTPEQLIMYVWIPEGICRGAGDIPSFHIAYEDWLLRLLGAPVNELSESFHNDHKDTREQPSFSLQEAGAVVLARNGCLYMEEKHAFRLRIACRLPLINGHSVNGKGSYRGVKALLDLICDRLETADWAKLAGHVLLYSRQRQIRAYLRENGLLAFVADGSTLPRQGTTQKPLPEAVPFQTPPSLRVTVRTSDGYSVTGMGLKQGITVITGGGYSGKSTLLDCLEQGIYDHVAGDGREYVISDETACKVYAEDGRYLAPTDLSPFFSYLPGNNSPHCFGTPHASGSVSQAANIVEAVYSGCRCLLIDEDTSATNFMIRDEAMRRLVKKEPIVPFTDRVSELADMGISTILVIGGSGEYLKYAHRVLLLEDYLAFDVTGQVAGMINQVTEIGAHESDPVVLRADRWYGLSESDTRTQQTGQSKLHKSGDNAQPTGRNVLYKSGVDSHKAEPKKLNKSDSDLQRTHRKKYYESEGRIQQTEQFAQNAPETVTHSWTTSRYLPYAGEGSTLILGQCIQIENARYLKIGGFTADITRLTALTEDGQPGSLTWLLEKLLFTEGQENMDLRARCEALAETLFSDSRDTVLSSRTHRYELCLEQVRSLDLLMAAFRLRPDNRK